MDDKKKLRRMAIWMIAVFAAAFAIVLTVLYLVAKGNIGLALASGWWLILILAVVCLAAYYGYKLYMNRKK
jgi:uncharacterized membrane protein